MFVLNFKRYKMKKELLEKKKFKLEKFEVAKLSGLKKIKGGNLDNGDTDVPTSGTHNDGGSSKACKMSVFCV